MTQRPSSRLQYGPRRSQQTKSRTVRSQWAQDESLLPGHLRDVSSWSTVKSARPAGRQDNQPEVSMAIPEEL